MSMSPEPLRPDLALIAQWVPAGAHVLDLACGDGALLHHLQVHKQCLGYGVEIDDDELLACVKRGVNVIQRDIEDGLDLFKSTRFDFVMLSMAIQVTHRTEYVLREMAEVGDQGIVSFPNFGHWFHAWSILRGRMPVSREMPYRWHDTPNLHLSTIQDFEEFLGALDVEITARAFFANGRRVYTLPNLRATQAVYRFRRRQNGATISAP